MTVSRELWEANQDLARECQEHPFVQGIATGTLPLHKFAYYVGQDAFFLGAFARAYSIAAARSPDLEGFETFHNLATGVLEELSLHEGYAAEWGVNLHDIEPAPATRRYTDFLLTTAWSHNPGLTAVAMAPCMQLYYFIGHQLAINGIPEHEYTEWIRKYSSEQFHQEVDSLEHQLDQYVLDSTREVHSTYRYTMLCERDFFQAAWEVEPKDVHLQ